MSTLPDLTSFDAFLFDLDGVLTPTAEVHIRAWQAMFDELFTAWDIAGPYTDDDYYRYVDGKKRYDGVASLLHSRNVDTAPPNRYGTVQRNGVERSRSLRQ